MAFDQKQNTVDVIEIKGLYMVQVVGKFQIAGQSNILNFSQSWMIQMRNNQPCITLEIFRPVY
eukprot:UN26713